MNGPTLFRVDDSKENTMPDCRTVCRRSTQRDWALLIRDVELDWSMGC